MRLIRLPMLRLLARPGWLFLVLCSSSIMAADEAPPLVFETPEDVVLAWATRAGLVLMAVSIALTLFVLVTRRRRLMELPPLALRYE